MKKLTEIELLKYWLDAEITILHTMFAVILWQLTTGWLPHTLLAVYIVGSMIYSTIRVAYVQKQDSKYLKVPKT